MPHILLIHAIPLLARYGYAIILPIAVVEGPVVTMITGALVAAGQMDAVVAGLLLIVADLVGDAGYYGLGRFGHAPLLKQISKRLHFLPERLGRLETRFRENDWKLIMIGKTQALGSLILYFAGASRMSFARYMMLNLIGTVPKVILFEAVGYFIGESILRSPKYIDYITVSLFGIALVLLVAYWLVRRFLFRDLLRDISL